MNTDMNAILARLQKGENPEDIANEFASIMNAAIQANKEEIQKQKEAEEAKKAAAAREATLDAAAKDMAVALKKYAIAAYPSLTDVFEDEEIDPGLIRSTMDAALASVILALSLEMPSFSAPPKTTPKSPKSSDDALADFLNTFVN